MDKGLRLVQTILFRMPLEATDRGVGSVGLGVSMPNKDARAKKDARARRQITGESYVAAKRKSAGKIGRLFIDDHCASCMEVLPGAEAGLFCNQLCQQTAGTMRYWRAIDRDGRINDPGVVVALRTQIAFIVSGGYNRKARAISASTRQRVIARDDGKCQKCGGVGQEIDHIAGDSAELTNLQLLCKPCHQAKTQARMSPASPEAKVYVDQLFKTRVQPETPIYLADDEHEWQRVSRDLKKDRKDRLIAEMLEVGLDPADFKGKSRADMFDALCDEQAVDYDDGGWTEDDDSGYGPYSYFAHAMAKDD